MKRTIRRALLCTIGGLYIVSVPWYRESGAAPEVVLGLPDWVTVALGCYVAVAVLNGIAWLLTDVPEALPQSTHVGGDPASTGEPR